MEKQQETFWFSKTTQEVVEPLKTKQKRKTVEREREKIRNCARL